MLAPRIQAPVVTATLLVLLAVMIGFWGRHADAPPSAGRAHAPTYRTATLSNIRANLADTGCMFTADVELGSVWEQMTFARIRLDARKEFQTMLRYKRRYMVENPVAREALKAEMARTVNHLAGADIATRVDLPRFEFY
jgi:hypothetical protein